LNYPPNSYGPQGPNPYQRPPQPPLPHQRFTHWYGIQWRRNKLLTGCLTLISAFVLCALCGAIGNASNRSAALIADTPTVQATATQLSFSERMRTSIALIKLSPTPTPMATPTPVPTPTPAPVQEQPTQLPAPTCNGTVMDGACYNTDSIGGSRVYNTPSDFCINYSCIKSFSTGTGYIVECGNGQWSHSGGSSGACSRDSGIIATLYRH
jgi:hypothetical protein